MSVTYTHTEYDASTMTAAAETELPPHAFDAESLKDSSACFGFLKVLEICADHNQQTGAVTISLIAFGVQVGRWVLDRDHTCIKIGLRPGVFPVAYAELDLEVCANFNPGGGVYLNGKACACAVIAGCTCAEFKDQYILHW